jgi:hypothetical protein
MVNTWSTRGQLIVVNFWSQGRKTYYEHRLTHQYTDKVLTAFKAGDRSPRLVEQFSELWDLFGPVAS